MPTPRCSDVLRFPPCKSLLDLAAAKIVFWASPFLTPLAVVIPLQPQPHLPGPISPHLASNEGGCVICLSCAPALPSGSQQQV